jgi:hypothetical protein
MLIKSSTAEDYFQYGQSAEYILDRINCPNISGGKKCKLIYINQTDITNDRLDHNLDLLTRWNNEKVTVIKYALTNLDSSYKVLNTKQIIELGSLLTHFPGEYLLFIDHENIIRYSNPPPATGTLTKILKRYLAPNFASLDENLLQQLAIFNDNGEKMTLGRITKNKNAMCVFYANLCETCQEGILDEIVFANRPLDSKVEIILLIPKSEQALLKNSHDFPLFTIDTKNYDLFLAGDPLIVLFQHGRLYKTFSSKFEIYSDLEKYLSKL